VRASQAAAKARGKSIRGWRAGMRVRLTLEKEQAVTLLYESGTPISEIARTLQLSRPTVFQAINRLLKTANRN
jgi:DNA invertase Pin-like site-specific DNA recombinase